MTKTKAPKKNIVDGEIEVCAHRVAWWFNVRESKITDELRERLQSEAEERSKAMISEGYVSGELVYYDNEKETDFSGWWDIKRD